MPITGIQEQGSEEWTASFAEKLDGSLEAWNALTLEDRLPFCASAGAAPGKKKCGGSKARSRSRSGGGGAKKRSKKGWTCYTHFFTEKLAAEEIKLSRVSGRFSATFIAAVAPGLRGINDFNSHLSLPP